MLESLTSVDIRQTLYEVVVSPRFKLLLLIMDCGRLVNEEVIFFFWFSLCGNEKTEARCYKKVYAYRKKPNSIDNSEEV